MYTSLVVEFLQGRANRRTTNKTARIEYRLYVYWVKSVLLDNIVENRAYFIMTQKWLSLEHRKCINRLAKVDVAFNFGHF